MARTDRDRWDLATSVGATATMVAAQRALSSEAKLIDDPYAAPLVRAVGIDVYVRLVNGEIEAGGNTEFDPRRMAQGMACRTRFYDQFFLDATRGGIGQVVILASGLDSRAYRLPWPAGTVVYEVDMPEVIEFKTLTLGDLGAEPTAQRRTVAIDLRDDWASALRVRDSIPRPLRVERRRPGGLSAGRRSGCAVRQRHLAERPRQSSRFRIRARHRGFRRPAVACSPRPDERTRLRDRLQRPRVPRPAQPHRRSPEPARLADVVDDGRGSARGERFRLRRRRRRRGLRRRDVLQRCARAMSGHRSRTAHAMRDVVPLFRVG